MSKTKFGYVVDRKSLSVEPIVYDKFEFDKRHSEVFGCEYWLGSNSLCLRGIDIYDTFEDAKAEAKRLIALEIKRLEQEISFLRSVFLADPKTPGEVS